LRVQEGNPIFKRKVRVIVWKEILEFNVEINKRTVCWLNDNDEYAKYSKDSRCTYYRIGSIEEEKFSKYEVGRNKSDKNRV